MSNARATSNGATRARAAKARKPDTPSGVTMNLDTLQREGEVDPFTVVIAGKPRVFLDPAEMDWQELATAAQDPRMVFQLALSPGDYIEVMEERIPVWKVNTLAETYLRYYGIDFEALGNRGASPIS